MNMTIASKKLTAINKVDLAIAMFVIYWCMALDLVVENQNQK